VQQTTLRVKEMHGAIADQSFRVLQRIPLLCWPTQLVQIVHDTIAAGVYTVIHHGSGGLLEAAAVVEKHHTGFAPSTPPGRFASGLHSALNGAFGDHLAASDSLLAISMALRVNGAAVSLDRGALRRAFPEARKRLCVFIHGLGCDEHGWDPGEPLADAKVHFGRELSREFACSSLYLRYNSGLPIAENCARLAVLLEDLLAAWPQPGSELVIIGHSMGGLIALGACDQAMAAGMQWPQSTRMLICLGSPHLGSPVERLGQVATTALNLTRITLPLGKIANARSQGVKDLRNGPGAQRLPHKSHAIAFRFLGASLTEDVDHPLAAFLGDGLVPVSSAIAHQIDGDVKSAAVGRLGHMGLLNDARVYRQVSEWLRAIEDPDSADSAASS
jgi:pimeloyl-ACP methyl ester carboxylesterase